MLRALGYEMKRDGVTTGINRMGSRQVREGSAVRWSEETIDVMSLGPMMKRGGGGYERARG